MTKYSPLSFSAIIILYMILAGCSVQKQTSENVNASEKAKNVSPERKRTQEKENWLGSEIVAESVSRISSRLQTGRTTNEKLNQILSNKFSEIGGVLNDTYENKQAREMGKKIIINAQQEIIPALENDEQRTAFKNLMLN